MFPPVIFKHMHGCEVLPLLHIYTDPATTFASIEIKVNMRVSVPHTYVTIQTSQNTHQHHILNLKINNSTSLHCITVTARPIGKILLTSYIPIALDADE